MAGAKGERSGVRLQLRGARLRLPRRAAQPAHITRPTHSAASPPAARPHPERARERVAGSRQGGADPRTSCPRDTGMCCSRLGGQLNNSAPFSLRRGVSNLTGCVPRFLFVTGCSGKAFRIKLGLNYQSAKQFLPEKDHSILLRQIDGFLKGMSLVLSL